MNHISRKLRSRRGETVAEVLLSVLVAGIAMALLAGSVTAAARLNKTAIETDAAFYKQLAAAEGRAEGGSNKTLTVTMGTSLTYDFAVTVYGADGELHSYGKR